MELEETVQRLSDDQVDRDSLLADIQSDKTALSRAMAQNKELKSQLAELQNGFVKMVGLFCHDGLCCLSINTSIRVKPELHLIFLCLYPRPISVPVSAVLNYT